MAHVDDNKGGRQVAVEPNLVPFIDLMSVLIIFLLITAVWTQVSMIQIGSSIYGKKTSSEVAEPPPRAEIPFRLDVTDSGYQVIVGSQKSFLPKINGEYDHKSLVVELKRIKDIYPDKTDAVITILDWLPYVSLIGGMDGLLEAGFPDIAIATAGAQ